MTKTDLSYKPAGDLRSAGDPSPAIDDLKNYAADVWFCSGTPPYPDTPVCVRRVQQCVYTHTCVFTHTQL